jgi:hypothetical protein
MEKFMFSNIVLSMMEFQKINNIKNQCVTNVQYLYDCVKMNHKSWNVKVKPVIVLSIDDNETKMLRFVSGHLILLLDNNETIIDPSYDVFSLKNKSYFDNVKDFLDNFDDNSKAFIKENLKKIICDFVDFAKLAERINNGELLICDEEFYNNQADYVEKIKF